MREYGWALGGLAASAIGSIMCVAGSASAHDNLGATGGSWDRGVVNAAFGAAQPWVRKYYSPAGQCLILAVSQLSANADLEMAVVSPNPRVRYVNDDANFNICFNCPKIVIPVTPVAGYYTVHLSHFIGQPVDAEFLLDFRRLPAGDQSCSPATPPVQ